MRRIDGNALTGLDWRGLVEALRSGHRLSRPVLDDVLLSQGERRMLVRAAWIDGLGAAVKAVTIYPDNPAASPPRPSVQGEVMLFDEASGAVLAIVDGVAITALKTAADSALGADLLARADIRAMLMVGAGAMAEPLIRAHLAMRPSIDRIAIWNRTAAHAEGLAARLGGLGPKVAVAADLADAVRAADLVCCATMATAPLISGEWLKPGAHLDLVGAYRPDMREADDAALTRAAIFVDSRATAIHDIGELADPIARGIIAEADVRADLYELVAGAPGRASAKDVTLFKNGGGAHLDLMTARHALDALGGAVTAPRRPRS